MLQEYLRVFRAFTDENRMQILELLCGGEQCACVLLEHLKISQPTLSHHMKILCKSGIVKSRRVGPWNYYSIHQDGCKYASQLLEIVAKEKLHTTIKVLKVLCCPFYGLQRVVMRRESERIFDSCNCQDSKKKGCVTEKG